jgi:hypothetical protein
MTPCWRVLCVPYVLRERRYLTPCLAPTMLPFHLTMIWRSRDGCWSSLANQIPCHLLVGRGWRPTVSFKERTFDVAGIDGSLREESCSWMACC